MTLLRFPAAAALVLLSGLAGTPALAQAPGQTPPPPPVGIVEVKARPVPIISELPGRIAPTRIAQVRPRVSGIVIARVFQQGSLVK